jgi:capsular exopolysaccharide synthesis family protein
MSRLTEALERALELSQRGSNAVTDENSPVQADARDGVPRAWRFSAESEAVEHQSTVDPTPVLQPFDGNDYQFGDAVAEKVVIGHRAERTLVEQYRQLAATLHHAQREHRVRSVMVTSAVPGEGKTLTASNLAITLSHSYQRRVLLIDADLRRPNLHEIFRLSNEDGLGDRLRRRDIGGRLPLRNPFGSLWVLTAGPPTTDPVGGLVSGTMKQLLNDAAEQFDWVVVDTPPVAFLPDANLMASMIDAALIIVSANSTPYPLVKRAADAIRGTRILGVVLNRADKSAIAGGYDYRYQSYLQATKPTSSHPSVGINSFQNQD